MSSEKGDAKTKPEQTESGNPPEKKPDFFETKLFKFITLALYLGGVSGMGFVLAVYYLFIWESKMPEIPIIKKF